MAINQEALLAHIAEKVSLYDHKIVTASVLEGLISAIKRGDLEEES